MIKNRNVAEYVHNCMLKCGKEIDNSIDFVQKRASEEDFVAYKKAVSKVLGEILFEVLNPIHEKYPDLKPEEFK